MATPVETVIQQILDDNLGPGAPQLYCPVSPGFMVTEYIPEYVSVWDALQTLVAQFGGWIGYKWIPDYNDFRLTLLIPPRGKNASCADWAFDRRQIIVQHLDISDRDIRNVVKVTYRDTALGKRATVTELDWDSILEFGRRAMQIEEADASMIDTATEATALAKSALHDLKDMTSTTRLTLPFVPTLDIFDGILVTNPRLSSTQDFYAVESVEHVLNFDRGQFRTEVVASGRVVGAHARWLLMETRPGSPGKPIDMPPPFTVIVAAAHSPTEERKKAQHFCDGVSDQETINSAIADLPASGGEVVLLSGTFTIDGPILMRSNITLRGQGDSTIIRLRDNIPAGAIFGMIENADRTNGNANIALRSFKLDGNQANNAAASTLEGIWLENVSGYLISQLQIIECRHKQISCRKSPGGRITSNYIRETGTQSAVGIELSSSDRCSVVGNIIDAASGSGIAVLNGYDCTISGNTVRNAMRGIYVYAGGVDGGGRHTVTGNAITSCVYQGIAVDAATNIAVVGNTVRLCGTTGIELYQSSHNTIANNSISENSQSAHNTYDNIWLEYNSDYNNIQGNTCRRGLLTNQPRYGIRINSADCDGNVVTNNDLYQSGVAGNLSDLGTGTVTTAGNRA